ncbi:hypothetical protein BGW39_008180, partial [Mortierella sp. 14UC]
MSSESTLVSFRRAIATHLAEVVGQSADDIFPLVQQNTSHRKASHSVFSVVIKRLQNLCNINSSSSNSGSSSGGGAELPLLVDEDVLGRCCSELSAKTRGWVLQARRTKDMLLFDPQPLQLIRLAIGSVVREYGQGLGRGRDCEVGSGSSVAEGEGVEEVLGKRAREEMNSET